MSAAGWRIDPPVSVPLAAEREARGDRGRRPTRGSARHARRIPRIAHRSEEARLVRRAHRELVHVGLAEQHRPGPPPPLDDGRVVRGDEVGEHSRPAGGQDPVGAEDVLVGDRHAGERPRLRPAPRAHRPLRASSSARSARDGDEGVERRPQPLDPREEVARDLDARKAARRETSRDFADGEGVHYSMTLGTR